MIFLEIIKALFCPSILAQVWGNQLPAWVEEDELEGRAVFFDSL